MAELSARFLKHPKFHNFSWSASRMFSSPKVVIVSDAEGVSGGKRHILQRSTIWAILSLAFFAFQSRLRAEGRTIYESQRFTLNGAVAFLCFQRSEARTEVTIAVIAPRKANGRIDDAFNIRYSAIKLGLHKKSGSLVHCQKAFKNDVFFIPILTGIGGLNGDYFCEKLDLSQLSYATLVFRGNEKHILLEKLEGS